MNFENKIALITGATSGIGKGIALALLKEGANVVINYSNNEKSAEQTREEFKDYASKIMFVKADISDEKQVIEMMKQIDSKYGHLDYLVNNAGIDFMESIEEFNLEHFRREVDVDFIGRFICIQKAIPLFKKSKTPKVINIASRLGTRPMSDSSAYCTCEAATIMLTKVCALELSKYNVKVNTVSPSLTLTPLARKSYTDEEIKATAIKNPSKRLGEIEDISNTVLFLLSSKADYINGENINVNGGILLV